MSNDIVHPLDPECGIYQILAPTGECYIGHSTALGHRRNQHLHLLRKGEHDNPLLQHAFDEFGSDLVFIRVELCPSAILAEREQWWIDNTTSAYNQSRHATTPFKTPAIKAKFMATISTPEHKQRQSKIGIDLANRPGRRDQMSKHQTDQNARPGAREAISAFQKIYQNLPEVSLAKKARGVEYMNRPDIKEMYAGIRAEINARPEVKAAIIKGVKKRFAQVRETNNTDATLLDLSMDELYELHLRSLRKGANPSDKPRARAARNRWLRLGREAASLGHEGSGTANPVATKGP
jgi:group I intron endonuclease